MKYDKNASIVNRVVPCGRTDGQTDMPRLNSRFSQFCKRA